MERQLRAKRTASRLPDSAQTLQGEARFQHLLQLVPGTLYQLLLSADGWVSFPFISSGSGELFGLEAEAIEANADLLLSVIHPDERAAFDRSITVSAETLQVWKWEGRIVVAEWQIKWIQGTSRPEKLSNGDILWNGVFVEITGPDRAIEPLQRQYQLQRHLLSSSPAVLYSFKATGDYAATLASENFTAQFGYAEEEFLENPGFWINHVHPDDRERILPLSCLLEKGYGIHEYRFRHKSGTYRWIQDELKVLWDEAGNPENIIGSWLDITECKQMEQTLTQLNEQLETRVEEQTTELRQTVQQLQQEIASRQQAQEILERSQAQLREKATQLEQALHELQKTQTQLVQVEKMSSLGQLVAGVAHEINNPLNFIYGNLIHVQNYTGDLLEVLRRYQAKYPHTTPEIENFIKEVDLPFLVEDLPHILNSMKVGGDRIVELVRSLRNFSRPEEAEVKVVDIHEGIDSTLMILNNFLREKPERPAINIIKAYEKLPLVECYPGPLNQVFMNIITNAIDALDELAIEGRFPEMDDETTDNEQLITDKSPTIFIRTQTIDSNRISIQIRDNGPGIPTEIQQQLFDPFFTTKTMGKGTGLGLAISYQIIVEKHQGKLRYISVPGHGTEFTIEIPIQQRKLRSKAR
jgi:two-component system, NtrC family, sensor kinase